MALLSPAPDVFSSRPLVAFRLGSFPKLWGRFNRNCTFRHFPKRCVSISNVVYAEDVTVSGTAKSARRREQIELERDSISILNERIRRFHVKRESSKTAMDADEADRYIQMVKEQQQRGLQKLKGDRQKKESDEFNYKADPYTLRSGDYVVHKKVGIGRFVGIRFDVQKSSTEPVEYVFIEYADGMAKLPVQQASRMLYRYSLYVFSLFYPLFHSVRSGISLVAAVELFDAFIDMLLIIWCTCYNL